MQEAKASKQLRIHSWCTTPIVTDSRTVLLKMTKHCTRRGTASTLLQVASAAFLQDVLQARLDDIALE
jgi:hypothetical protein